MLSYGDHRQDSIIHGPKSFPTGKEKIPLICVYSGETFYNKSMVKRPDRGAMQGKVGFIHFCQILSSYLVCYLKIIHPQFTIFIQT